MYIGFLTRQVFDTLIIIVIMVGLALAAVRLYADLSRPLPPEEDWRAGIVRRKPAAAPEPDEQPTTPYEE